MRFLLLPLWITLFQLSACAASRPNVLFIVADDLRCDLPAFGATEAITPNLNKLAARSRVFGRAYCQQAVCNPSRVSMMTGLRPDSTGVTDLRVHFRETQPGVTTLPQHFKNNGYEAVGLGKIYHNYHLSIEGDPASWSQLQRFHWGNHRMDQPKAPGFKDVPFNQLPAIQSVDVPDNAYLDGRIADAAVEALGNLKGKPFFLAVGFWKPHMPYNAPKRYWDLYDRSKIALPAHSRRPQGAPDIAIHNSPEPRGYRGIPAKGPLTAEMLTELRHGYLAGVSFLDANVGKVLDELERLGLAKDTIVVFWSDNGYHLGENEMVGKLTNFEIAARVPMMIATPEMTRAGTRTDSLVEMVDLYPTLQDLCNLPPPPHTLEGVSLRSLLENPAASVKTTAISQHPDRLEKPGHMGYSVRTAAFRYTEWRSLASGDVTARELYQYDQSQNETRNLALDPQHAALVSELAAQLPASPKPRVKAPPPPGTVIHHSPASSGLYIGSPSLCILPNGDYLACHDLFGPASNEHQLAKGRLYRSTDKGATWKHLHDFNGFFWTGLFVHRGNAFLLGLDKHHGRILIRRSSDSGTTWTPPTVLAEGQWHTAPVPVIEHKGRIWRAIEDAENGTKWGERYRARMMSAPADSDLMDAGSWTFSNPLARDAMWLGNDFAAWLEGNAVADPQGNMVNLLRVDNSKLPEKAAIVRIDPMGGSATFDPVKDIIDFPGGSKKFTIRKDPQGAGYWSLASIIADDHRGGGRPASIRNTLALIHSKDLRVWETRSILLRHPDVVKHGFQYVDWQFEGNDIIATCRTAWDDAEGGTRNNHDANFLTFHRWKDFRSFSRKDDVPDAGPVILRTHVPDMKTPTLGLPALPGAVITELYQADGTTPQHQGAYSHHPHITFHAGKLFAIWSNHLKDEDAAGQRVYLRFSGDLGATWSPPLNQQPSVLFPSLDDWKYENERAEDADRAGTANGFAVVGKDLYAINEVLPCISMQKRGKGRLARRILDDGALGEIFWLREKRPDTPAGYPEYPDMSDTSVRQKALAIKAVVEDPSRRSFPSWDFDGAGNTSTELREPPAIPEDGHMLCEPTCSCQLPDGSLMILWRDLGIQGKKSYRLYATHSNDNGKHWSRPLRTEFPDAGSRPNAGNLPGGGVYVINNPIGLGNPGGRQTLAISLAADGLKFDRSWWIRAEMTKPRFPGRFKGPGFAYPHSCIAGGSLFVIYSVNKEDVEICRIPLESLTRPR